MLWRSDEEKDPTLNGKDEQVNNADQDLSVRTRKALDDVKTLRKTIDALKAKREGMGAVPEEEVFGKLPEAGAYAGKEAVEAQQRVLEKKREIQRLRQIQIEAERNAAAVRRRQELEVIEAGKREKKEAIPPQIIAQREAEVMEKRRNELEQKRQNDQEKLLAQQRKLLEQQRKLLLEEQRKMQEQKRRAQEQQRKKERQQLIEQERKLQRERRERADAEIRQIKAEQEAQRKAQRKERSRLLKEEWAHRSELRRQRRLADRSAELGGGIVNVHGVTVKTEIEPVPAFSWIDILGIVTRREKRAVNSEETLKQLLEEKERTRDEARKAAVRLVQLKRTRRQNSTLGRRYLAFRDFCDAKKKPLLVAFAIVLMAVVGTAGVINFFTVFEYSYNGQTLGYVNDKDHVVQITDLVQEALSEDTKFNVVIDPRDDISFKRILDFNREKTVDDSDEVLRRLTYMGDLNVKAYGIYIDGKKIGTVKDKDAAADVLQTIKDGYKSTKAGSEIEEAVIVEDIQIRRINSDLQDIRSEDNMVQTLCTSGQKETIHKVIVGETLADIATDYGTTERQLEKDNPGVDPKKLEVGSALVIKTNGPLMTVKITEVRTYDKKVKYKTEKKKDKNMYEGYSEIDQKGKNGLSTLTDRTISINGEVVETDNLKTTVKKKPVTKILRVGTKDRPPTVGSGKFIWPAKEGTYTVTSEFKWRWGRHHDGIDLGCSQGTIVMASDGGTVTYAGYMGGYGNLVIIDHQNGMETYYGHNSSLTVSVGDKVFQGQQIAYSGNTGRSTGPHIHFGIMVDGTFVNPREFLP